MIPYTEMKIKQEHIAIIATIGFVVVIFIVALLTSKNSLQHIDIHDNPFYDDPEMFVTNVIDGDTIEIIGGDRVRYIGIDTPEIDYLAEEYECFAEEALERNRELVEGTHVRLERDTSNRDRYDRLLRYVYVDDVFINETLVREGYARAVSYPPDTKYYELFEEAEQEAREHERGMWKECE